MRTLIKLLFLTLACHTSFGQSDVNFPKHRELVQKLPPKEKTWVFIMAGQSNMAGRGFVEPKDTMSSERIISINKNNELIFAKEPLHWYEPNATGLDCGMSFAQNLLTEIPPDITILLLPVAIGGSSMNQWLGDSTFRGVQLYSNFKEKAALGQTYGEIKGIIWLQGESDSSPHNIPIYQEKVKGLFANFRQTIGNENLPIIMAELGSYSKNYDNWQLINKGMHSYSIADHSTKVIHTQDLHHKGDFVHFNSAGQREIGNRFAKSFLSFEN